MKKRALLILLISIFLFPSCGAKYGKKHEQRSKRDQGYVLFEKAEIEFNARAYVTARRLYQEYLRVSPSGQMVPASLFKIGVILSQKGEVVEARDYFNRIIQEFPDSFFYGDAKVEYLFTYYKEGRYQEVIDQAEQMRDGVPPSHALRADLIVGDAFMALNRPAEAFAAHIRPDIDFRSKEGKTLSERIRQELALLNDQEIALVLNRYREDEQAGTRIVQLGKAFADEGNFVETVKILTGFIASFPDHDGVPEALSLIDTSNTMSRSSEFIVGCLLPLSGSYKNFGEKALKGIEMALTKIDDPRLRDRIKLIIKDTASDTGKTKSLVRELHEEKAVAIIGPITNPEAGAQEAQALKLPMIVLSQKAGLTDIGDYIFRNFITPEMQVQAIVDYAFNTLYLSRFAILYPEEKYGQTFMNLFRDQVVKQNGTIIGSESYKAAASDFSGPIRRILGNAGGPVATQTPNAGENIESGSPFDAIFIPDEPKTVALILPQLAYHNITKVRLLGTNLWHSDAMIKLAKNEIQGAIVPEGFFENSTLPHVRSFVDRFKATYGETPGFIEAIVYDTAAILFKVAEYPSAGTREGVKQALLKINYADGITGSTTFSPSGEAEKEIHLLTVDGDRFVEVGSKF